VVTEELQFELTLPRELLTCHLEAVAMTQSYVSSSSKNLRVILPF
jgi:hypothetical protein